MGVNTLKLLINYWQIKPDMLEQVALNKSRLLLKNILQNIKNYSYLHTILKQKFFTKVIKNASLEGLGWEI